MVENQIRPNKVTDTRVTQAMEAIPRELFVPKHLRGIAYVDEDIDVGGGRFLMEPMVFARLLQAAEIKDTDVALDIGCGTGYSAGVLAKLASTVVAVEGDGDMAKRASALLGELGIDNAAVVKAPLAEGYPQQAPYDVIVFEGAVAEIPQSVCGQLADGGRLLAVVQDSRGVLGKATLVTRAGAGFGRRVLFEAGTPLLPGFARQPGFVF
jgi:protein-L-isoaspartate(D-aspartate) O-methyltransferase